MLDKRSRKYRHNIICHLCEEQFELHRFVSSLSLLSSITCRCTTPNFTLTGQEIWTLQAEIQLHLQVNMSKYIQQDATVSWLLFQETLHVSGVHYAHHQE
jgi:hypothetical protein